MSRRRKLHPSEFAKALVALATAVSAWGVTASVDGKFDEVELFGLLGALATAIGVFYVPNIPAPGALPDPKVSEQGHAELGGLLYVVLVIVVIVVLLRVVGLL